MAVEPADELIDEVMGIDILAQVTARKQKTNESVADYISACKKNLDNILDSTTLEMKVASVCNGLNHTLYHELKSHRFYTTPELKAAAIRIENIHSQFKSANGNSKKSTNGKSNVRTQL